MHPEQSSLLVSFASHPCKLMYWKFICKNRLKPTWNKKRNNLNSETYLFEEAFSAVVIIVATCPPRRCHDASRRGNTHAQHDLQAASSRSSLSLFDRSWNFNQSARYSQTVLGVHSFASVSPNEYFSCVWILWFLSCLARHLFFSACWEFRDTPGQF